MAVHTIILPDWLHGRQPRSILWDDEAGTFAGAHSSVADLQAIAEQAEEDGKVVFTSIAAVLTLRAPGRYPADLLALLAMLWHPVLRQPMRSQLPAPLRDAEPTLAVAHDIPEGAIA